MGGPEIRNTSRFAQQAWNHTTPLRSKEEVVIDPKTQTVRTTKQNLFMRMANTALHFLGIDKTLESTHTYKLDTLEGREIDNIVQHVSKSEQESVKQALTKAHTKAVEVIVPKAAHTIYATDAEIIQEKSEATTYATVEDLVEEDLVEDEGIGLGLEGRTVKVEQAGAETMSPKLLIFSGLAHGDAGTQVGIEEARTFRPVKPAQSRMVSHLLKTPLIDQNKVKSQIDPKTCHELNNRFSLLLHRLNALTAAMQQRGPQTQDLDQTKKLLANLQELQVNIETDKRFETLYGSEYPILLDKFSAARIACKDAEAYHQSLMKYMEANEGLDNAMEQLSDQLKPDTGLHDLSTHRVPEVMNFLCNQELFGSNVGSLDEGIKEGMLKRLTDDLTWHGVEAMEDWIEGFQKSIANEEQILRQSLLKFTKNPPSNQAEAREMVSILCQIELLEKTLSSAKENFDKAADIISKRIEFLSSASIWGYEPKSEQHTKIITKLKEVQRQISECGGRNYHLEAMMEEHGLSLHDMRNAHLPFLRKHLAKYLPPAINQSQTLIKEKLPFEVRENRLAELKLLYFTARTLDPHSKQTLDLEKFLNKEVIGHQGINPLNDKPEDLRLYLAAFRPPPKRSLLGKLYHAVFSPEEWSQSTKENVSLLFTSMQLMQTAIQLSTLPEQAAQLKARADAMQRSLIERLPEKVQRKIKQETESLGNRIGDNEDTFNRLKKDFDSPDFHSRPPGSKFEKSFKKIENIDLENALIGVFSTHQTYESANKSLHEIKQVFALQQAIKALGKNEIGSPFHSIPFSDWIEALKTPLKDEVPSGPIIPEGHVETEGDKLALTVSKVGKAKKLAEEIPTPVTSAASRANGIVPSIIKGFGKLLTSINPFSTTESVPKEFRAQSHEALRSAADTLPELQQKIEENPTLVALKDEVNLLHNQLLKAVSEAPEDTCSLQTMAFWSQRVDDICYGLKDIEARVAKTMDAAQKANQIASSANAMTDAQLSRFGKKHMNLIKQARLIDALDLPGVTVPVPQGVSSDQITAFLKKESPEVFEHWQALGVLHKKYSGDKPFLESPEAAAHLKSIDQALEKVFEKASSDGRLLPQEFTSWIEAAKAAGDYLMVRSTGSEDSRQTANAGGNVSKAYVPPEKGAVTIAIGEVVRSYFGYSSLQNRINAGLNPFDEELRLAATAQQLIGEPIGGAEKPQDIPVSIVLFSNEPLYTGEEDFRVMRLSASYGHGEGVVGNMGIATDNVLVLYSLSQPDKLYISYDNQEKYERLAPVQTESGVRLQKTKNPPQIASKPCLSSEMVARLFHLATVEEAFFDHHPTDMEIVVKGDTIYPVQARPVNRQSLLPTYLDLKKVASLTASPIIDQVHGEVVVVGKASVVTIDKPSQILSKPTLEEAERAFRKGEHRLVVVAKQEPANSHPVVNFSALGIPCLFVSDTAKAEAMIAKVDDRHALAVDVQTATLTVWDKQTAKVDDFVSEGFAVHPAKVSQSIVELPPAVPSGSRRVPQEIKDLLFSMRMATTKEVALETLTKLQQHGWIQQMAARKAELEKQLQATPNLLAQRELRVLRSIESRAMRVFEETREAILKEGRLQPLFHAKALETIIVGNEQSTGLSQYAISDVESIAASADLFIAYQQQLAHPAQFADILVQGKHQAPFPQLFDQWHSFLLKLESVAHPKPGEIAGITKEEIQQFKSLINMLAKEDFLSSWLHFSFSKVTQMQPQEALRTLLNDITPKERQHLRRIISERERITQMERQLDRFAQPSTFEEAFVELRSKTQEFSARRGYIFNAPTPPPMPAKAPSWWETLVGSQTPLERVSVKQETENLKQMLESPSTTVKVTALRTMEKLVTTYDAAIKTMKASPHFNTQEKVALFKKMLNSYVDLFEGWKDLFDDGIPDDRQLRLDIDEYTHNLKTLINFAGNGEDELTAEPGFIVANALPGGESVIKSFPHKLEGGFTLNHQSLMVLISRLTAKVAPIKDLNAPPKLKMGMKVIEDAQLKVHYGWKLKSEITGITVDKNGVEVQYNVPLMQHAARLTLNYDKAKDVVIISGSFSGNEEYDRWKNIGRAANLFAEAGLTTLDKPAQVSSTGVSLSWVATNQEEVEFILNEFYGHALFTFHGDIGSQFHFSKDISSFNTEQFIKLRSFALDRQSPLQPEFYDAVVERFNLQSKFESLSDTTKAIIWSRKEEQSKLLDFFHAKMDGRSPKVANSPILQKFEDSFKEEVARDLPGATAQAAKLGLLSEDKNAKEKSLKLFELLMAKGHHREVEAVLKEWLGGNEVQKERLLSLTAHLVDNGHMDFVANLVRENLSAKPAVSSQQIALQMVASLVEKGHFHEEAAALVSHWKDADIAYRRSFQNEIANLSVALAEQNHAIDLNLEVALLLEKDGQALNSLAIFNSLVSNPLMKNAFSSAEASVMRWIKSDDSSIQNQAILLVKKLIERGTSYEVGEAVVRVLERNFKTRDKAIDILLSLNKKGFALTLFKEMADRGISSSTKDDLSFAFDMYTAAVKNKLHFQEAIAFAKAQIDKGESYDLRTLFRELVRQKQALREAEQYGIQHASKMGASLHGFFLSVLENGGDPESAAIAALKAFEKEAGYHNELFLKELFSKKIGFEKAREAIVRMENSDDKNNRESAKYLQSMLKAYQS